MFTSIADMSTKAKTRLEAVQMVNQFCKVLTPLEAKQILMGMGTVSLELARRFLKTYVNGWYYDADCTKFCSEVMLDAVVNKTIEFFDNTKNN